MHNPIYRRWALNPTFKIVTVCFILCFIFFDVYHDKWVKCKNNEGRRIVQIIVQNNQTYIWDLCQLWVRQGRFYIVRMQNRTLLKEMWKVGKTFIMRYHIDSYTIDEKFQFSFFFKIDRNAEQKLPFYDNKQLWSFKLYLITLK